MKSRVINSSLRYYENSTHNLCQWINLSEIVLHSPPSQGRLHIPGGSHIRIKIVSEACYSLRLPTPVNKKKYQAINSEMCTKRLLRKSVLCRKT